MASVDISSFWAPSWENVLAFFPVPHANIHRAATCTVKGASELLLEHTMSKFFVGKTRFTPVCRLEAPRTPLAIFCTSSQPAPSLIRVEPLRTTYASSNVDKMRVFTSS